MKSSKYLCFAKTPKGRIGYCTMNESFVYLKESEYNKIFETTTYGQSEENNETYKKLIEAGFLVPDDKDEFAQLEEEYQKEITSSSVYDLTLLPTLDCNLRCWYCFEKHIVGSRLSEEIQTKIINHVKYVFEKKSSLSHLSVELFGGEPLLYFKEELYPLLLKIKTYVESIGKSVSFFFVTNAVCITEEEIPLFKTLGANFQISIDGYKEKHDKIKFVPGKQRNGTYDQVIRTIYQLTEQIENVFINLRVNYDDETLLHIDELMKDLIKVNRNKIRIHLERVWQTGKNLNPNNILLKNKINLFILNGFNVSYMNLSRRSYSCKSSKENQATISYDGTVYKCTGRDFNDALAEGRLEDNGSILWNEEKLNKRLAIHTFDNPQCRECKFLPLCWGPCNQKQLENGSEKEVIDRFCQLKLMELSLDDYVCYRFNNEYNRRNS